MVVGRSDGAFCSAEQLVLGVLRWGAAAALFHHGPYSPHLLLSPTIMLLFAPFFAVLPPSARAAHHRSFYLRRGDSRPLLEINN